MNLPKHYLLYFELLCVFSFTTGFGHLENNVIHLTESNWTQSLKGEWLIKFHAPWCPACQNLEATWKEFSKLVSDKEIKVAEIDITQNPSVTGIFFITALPTIYHAKNSEFRIYNSARTEEALEEFVRKEKYTSLDAVPWIYSPSSFHMYIFGQFIRFCVMIKDIHSWMVETMGVPSWISYIGMGVATLLFGLLFGLLLICCCDLICPPRPQAPNVLFGREPKRPSPEFDSEIDNDPDVLEDQDRNYADRPGGDEVDDVDVDNLDEDSSSTTRQRKI